MTEGSRRDFLKATVIVGAAVATGDSATSAAAATAARYIAA